MHKGKYVKINLKKPSAVGVCDRSGFVFNHKDLVRQMEWRGNNLVWTGLLVGAPFVDEPDRQNKLPKTKNDPKIIKDARIPEDYSPVDSNPVLPTGELIEELNKLVWVHTKI